MFSDNDIVAIRVNNVCRNGDSLVFVSVYIRLVPNKLFFEFLWSEVFKVFLLVKKHYTKNIFEKFCYLGLAQLPYFFRAGPNNPYSHNSKTTCARDLIQVSKDAECPVFYSTLTHHMDLSGLDFM